MTKSLANAFLLSAFLFGANASSDPENLIISVTKPPTPSTATETELAEGNLEAYGGGGSDVVVCPVGASWAGNGNYCLGGDLYYCSRQGDSYPRLVERCVTTCQQNPPGIPDRCHSSGIPGEFCYSDRQCRHGQICSRGLCVERGHGGGHGRYCSSDYHCAPHQVCNRGRCVTSGGAGHYCRSSRDCRYGDVCLLGQCQPAFPDNGGDRCFHNNDCTFGSVCVLGQCQAVLPGAGTCNSCDNSGCGFGERCVHEGIDYSCNGVCRRGGNGGGPSGRRCSENSDCSFGSICLLGTCRSVFS